MKLIGYQDLHHDLPQTIFLFSRPLRNSVALLAAGNGKNFISTSSEARYDQWQGC